MNERFHVEGNEGLCSYIWEDSPWLNEFNSSFASFMEIMDDNEVNHYVFLGGDYNVEILALGEVEIKAVQTAT